MRYVVWDWNGTLLDDLTCAVQVTNQLLDEFALPRLSGVDDYHRVFRFPVSQYYADLGFDVTAGGNFEAASRRFLELYLAAARSCALHSGAVATLAALHEAGIGQVLISASEQTNLSAQVAPLRPGPMAGAGAGTRRHLRGLEEGSGRTLADRLRRTAVRRAVRG